MAAYTGTPRTWAAAEKVTATLLNAELRDPLAALAGAWTSYTPTLGGFTAGNGTATGAYLRVGKLIHFRAKFTFGSTSAAATAAPTLTLPVTSATTFVPVAGAFADVTGSTWFAPGLLTSTSVLSLYVPGTNGQLGTPTTTSPFTWAVSDFISVSGTYEAA